MSTVKRSDGTSGSSDALASASASKPSANSKGSTKRSDGILVPSPHRDYEHPASRSSKTAVPSAPGGAVAPRISSDRLNADLGSDLNPLAASSVQPMLPSVASSTSSDTVSPLEGSRKSKRSKKDKRERKEKKEKEKEKEKSRRSGKSHPTAPMAAEVRRTSVGSVADPSSPHSSAASPPGTIPPPGSGGNGSGSARLSHQSSLNALMMLPLSIEKLLRELQELKTSAVKAAAERDQMREEIAGLRHELTQVRSEAAAAAATASAAVALHRQPRAPSSSTVPTPTPASPGGPPAIPQPASGPAGVVARSQTVTSTITSPSPSTVQIVAAAAAVAAQQQSVQPLALARATAAPAPLRSIERSGDLMRSYHRESGAEVRHTPPPSTHASSSSLSRVLSGAPRMQEFDELYEAVDVDAVQNVANVVMLYQARARKSGQRVLVKQLLMEHIDEAETQQFLREVANLRALDHPNIVRLVDFFQDGHSYFVVVERLDGKQLFMKIVERGHYSESDACRLVRQICSAMAYFHSKGIAHRDLKPENLICIGDGDSELVKIADFSLSKNFFASGLMTAVGSSGYVAPEVIAGGEYDQGVDVWALGVIVYIMLCGYPPFFAETRRGLLQKITECSYSFEDGWEIISDDAKDFVRHLLVKDPRQRFSAAQCLQHRWLQPATPLVDSTLLLPPQGGPLSSLGVGGAPRNPHLGLTKSVARLKTFIDVGGRRSVFEGSSTPDLAPAVASASVSSTAASTAGPPPVQASASL